MWGWLMGKERKAKPKTPKLPTATERELAELRVLCARLADEVARLNNVVNVVLDDAQIDRERLYKLVNGVEAFLDKPRDYKGTFCLKELG